MTDKELLKQLNYFIADKIDSDSIDVQSTLDTLNKISEINSLFASYIKGKMDPLRKNIFLDQINIWTESGDTTREFSSLFRGK